eukprot:2644978-Amphidinium_carterae.1
MADLLSMKPECRKRFQVSFPLYGAFSAIRGQPVPHKIILKLYNIRKVTSVLLKKGRAGRKLWRMGLRLSPISPKL